MYKCEHCKKVSSPNEKMTKVVTAIRDKTYFNGKVGGESYGKEIVHEKKLCLTSANELDVFSNVASQNDEVAQASLGI